MNRDSLQAWLDGYIEAWRTYDVAMIGALFSEDAFYYYSPFDEDEPLRGRAAIIASWLDSPDDPGSWEARYTPVAVEGNVAVAQGRTRYLRPDGSLDREFANVFIMHFDDAGRCTKFTEWFMESRGE
jgi:hypothetical protein